jgi:hypothetical protein
MLQDPNDNGICLIAEYFHKNDDINDYIMIETSDIYNNSNKEIYEKLCITFLKYQIYLKILIDNVNGMKIKSLNSEISFTKLFELYNINIDQTICFDGIYTVDYLSIQDLDRFANCYMPKDIEYRENIDGIATIIDEKIVLLDIANSYENICFAIFLGKNKFNVIIVSFLE